MRPAPFEYVEPTSVADACAELHQRVDAAVLAGGQSLIAELNARRRRPSALVGLRLIDELATVAERDGGLCIGASVTQRAVRGASAAPGVLCEALDHVGHVPTRNRGTVGGSLAFADPTAELPAVLLGMGGSVCVRSVRGERVIEATELFTGPFRTALRPDELLTSVRLPVVVAGERWVFEQRHFRRHAKVSVVAGLRDGRVRVAVSGLADIPLLVQVLAEDADGLPEALAELVTPNADRYGSPAYRGRLVEVAARAAVRRLIDELVAA